MQCKKDTIILDCNSVDKYLASHIFKAINVVKTKIILKSMEKGNDVFFILRDWNDEFISLPEHPRNYKYLIYGDDAPQIFNLMVKNNYDVVILNDFSNYMFVSTPKLPEKFPQMNVNCYIKHSISEILPGLFLGDAADARNLDSLDKLNIKYLVTVAKELEPSPTRKSLKLRIEDTPSENIKDYFGIAFNFINEKLPKGNVLVHCMMGISRSATIMIAYLMMKNRMTFQEAFNFVKEKRPIIAPNFGFLGQLVELEKYIFSINS